MLIIWGVVWGAFFGGALGHNDFLGAIAGGFFGFFAGLSLQLIMGSKIKASTAEAQRALATAWEAEEARKRSAERHAEAAKPRVPAEMAAASASATLNTMIANPVKDPFVFPATGDATSAFASNANPAENVGLVGAEQSGVVPHLHHRTGSVQVVSPGRTTVICQWHHQRVVADCDDTRRRFEIRRHHEIVGASQASGKNISWAATDKQANGRSISRATVLGKDRALRGNTAVGGNAVAEGKGRGIECNGTVEDLNRLR